MITIDICNAINLLKPYIKKLFYFNTATTYTWKDAIDTAENLIFANESDWRVPNIKELSSIVETACYDPAINEEIFPNTESLPQPKFYWSSSPKAYVIGGYIFWVTFYNGNDFFSLVTDNGYVRLVRGGDVTPLNNNP